MACNCRKNKVMSQPKKISRPQNKISGSSASPLKRVIRRSIY